MDKKEHSHRAWLEIYKSLFKWWTDIGDQIWTEIFTSKQLLYIPTKYYHQTLYSASKIASCITQTTSMTISYNPAITVQSAPTSSLTCHVLC